MNKLKFLLAAAALIVAGNAAAQDINAKYAQAAEAVAARNYAAAVPLFEQVIAEGAMDEAAATIVDGSKKALPTALYQMGGIAVQAGRYDEALAAFTKAAQVAEEYGNAGVMNNARTWIGRTVLRQGAEAFNAKDYAAAAAIFQRGYDGNPNDMEVAINLAMSYSGLKDFEKSGAIYKDIIEKAAADSRFAEAAGKATESWSLDVLEQASESARANDFATAVAVTDGFLAVVPNDAAANLTRLQAYNSMKNYAKVIEVGDAAVEAQTTDELRSDANFLIGAAYQNTQNYAKAIEYYRKVTAGGNVAAARAQVTELQKVA